MVIGGANWCTQGRILAIYLNVWGHSKGGGGAWKKKILTVLKARNRTGIPQGRANGEKMPRTRKSCLATPELISDQGVLLSQLFKTKLMRLL